MNDIIKKAQQIGINPSQNKGQNFLIDEEVLQGIITIADIKKKDQILEIGPGFGVLTRELLYAGADVLSVELDKKLAAYLKKEFKDNSHLQILEKDILSVSNQEIFKALNGAFRVVSNIPYHITGKIIKKLVSSELPKPESAVLLVQKEVAERVCAEKGNMSMLALSVQAYACPRIALDVDKESFWPVPKVDSSVLVIEGIRETLRTPLCPPLVKGGKGGEASLEKGGEASL
ncbi:MAG: ribosomal RNA small subunit methyltransferase A, partial [Parcubacteria group bacterium CG_4_9_14_0_2_um_filter_41_8]